tara:strand:- start:3966 stop:4244 length:279 start_codon:yes stop_codon:yes gene_type:complete
MYLEIISPEATLFSGDVESLSVPGTDGSFQVLENHAAIVSTLVNGKIEIKGTFDSTKSFDPLFKKNESNSVTLEISSGTIELQDNKMILLVD